MRLFKNIFLIFKLQVYYSLSTFKNILTLNKQVYAPNPPGCFIYLCLRFHWLFRWIIQLRDAQHWFLNLNPKIQHYLPYFIKNQLPALFVDTSLHASLQSLLVVGLAWVVCNFIPLCEGGKSFKMKWLDYMYFFPFF